MLPLCLMKDQWGKTGTYKGKGVLAFVLEWDPVLKFAYSLFGNLWRISMNHEGFDHFRDWVFWIFITSTHSQNWFAGGQDGAIGRSLLIYQRRALLLSHSEQLLCSEQTLLCLTLCNLMDSSTPGFPDFHYLLEFSQIHVHWAHDTIKPSHPLSPSSPPAFSLSQHQGRFQRVSSLHQMAKGLKLQLQHQSFQWILRVDFLEDWLLGPPCCPRNSQKSSRVPPFESISSSVLSIFVVQLSHPHLATGETAALTIQTFAGSRVLSRPRVWNTRVPNTCDQDVPAQRFCPLPASQTMRQHTGHGARWPDVTSCWDNLIADDGGWDAGNKDLCYRVFLLPSSNHC